ncbi:MAG: hypothetical protein K2H63_09875 [Paramuribaculum sp.]|nr:hypothetical protein [Paramuribaculum sp.]
MSEQEMNELNELLNKALNESFRKMLNLKKKLGQSIVISDGKGHPITISAEEAEKLLAKD